MSMEPRGDARADWQMARLASVMANIHRRKQSRKYTEKDFLLKFVSPWVSQQQSVNEMKTALFATIGGRPGG